MNTKIDKPQKSLNLNNYNLKKVAIMNMNNEYKFFYLGLE